MTTFLLASINQDLLAVDTDDTDAILGTQALRLPGGIADNAHLIGDAVAVEIDDADVDVGTIGLLLRAAWEEREYAEATATG